MIRYKCTVSYDGTAYEGWQTQKRGNSIQEQIESSLARITGTPVNITASGRTDAGVSARAQVFHFDTEKDMSGRKWAGAINAGLPPDIHIMSVEKVTRRFHARHCVRWKRYTYRVNDGPYDVFTRNHACQCPVPLDFARMQETVPYLTGRHDFTALNSSTLAEYPDQVRTVEKIELERRGNMILMTFQAKGFLRYMVRMLSAQLIEVGKGKLSPQDVKAILDSRSKSVSKRNAPACGLTLEEVSYYDVMAMSSDAVIREYILKDDIPEGLDLFVLERNIAERKYPMTWLMTSRRGNVPYGQVIHDASGIRITVNGSEYLAAAAGLEEDIRRWLAENGMPEDTPVTICCGNGKSA